MKKKTLASLLGAASAIALFTYGVQTANADDSSTTNADTEKTSKAVFNVTPGDIKLTNVPSFDFGPHSVSDLISGLNKAVNTTNESLTVTDETGTNSEDTWNVTAQMGQFENNDNANTQIEGTITLGEDNGATGSISNSSTTVWDSKNISPINHTGANTANIAKDATLTTTGTTSVDTGNYTSTVTWNLNNTAATTDSSTEQ